MTQKTTEETCILNAAHPFYNRTGANSWEHIRFVVAQGTHMVLDHMKPTPVEYAAFYFHDASVKERPDKAQHNSYSASIAWRELPKLNLFNKDQLTEICIAIAEHDPVENPAGVWSSDTSDLLASADFNPPQLDWILNKAYTWGIRHKYTHMQCVEQAFKYMPRKYGSSGTVKYPDHYVKFYGSDIQKLQYALDNLQLGQCECIITEYRRMHHLSELDTKLPNPDMQEWMKII